MATSQPIALPAPNPDKNQDYAMGSYSGSHGGPFNPASYTRHFLGSPISWRAGSFGSRFPQGSPSANLFSTLDNPKQGSSIDDVMNAFNVFDREGELCRNYNCCGLHLPDLHALLEHFEEAHVLVVDPQGGAQIAVPFNPQPVHDPDDMELDLDLDNSTLPSARSSPASTSPPHTPSNPALAQFAHTYGYPSAHTSPYASQPPSPGSAQPQVHFPHPAGAPPPLAHPEEVFNTYARFSADYSSHMPGTQFNPSGGDEIHVPNAPFPQPSQQQGIPPALLFAAAADQPAKLKLKVRGTQPASSPSTPATPSTASAHSSFPPPSAASTPGPSSVPPPLPPQSTASTPARTTPSHTPLPAAPSLLLSKPFRCPKPNCNKSYKQANGLKYHMTHGSCNFAPPKDLEHVKDLLERKRREREASAGLSRSASLSSLSPSNAPNGEPLASQLVNAHGEPLLHNLYGDLGCITETELREVEREAEKRVRPFACGVGDCQRRYKNMNGLRYHYQHSGDHGAVGLALLAGGLHECLGNNNNNAASTSASAADGGKVKPEPEREGRRRAAAAVRGMMHGAHAHTHMHGRGGAASTPVSRATSVVPSSRVGTPQPSCNASTTAGMMMQKSASAYAASGSASASASASASGSGVATPFTPGYTNPIAANAIANDVLTHLQQQQHQGSVSPQHPPHPGTGNSPPLTPLTAAVQGLGLSSSGSSGSPTRGTFSPAPVVQQQQQGQEQQMAYQNQFMELQRRQYMQQMQQQFQAQAQAQQQQYSSPPPQTTQLQDNNNYVLAEADARAQQEFVEAQRREFEQQQMMGQMGMGMDAAMA